MADDKQKYIEVLKSAKARIPYVLATLNPGNVHPAKTEGWIEVHAGRAASSVVQLQNLLNEIEKLDGHD